ncbi:MAG: MFS transporter [Gammaproteobacteria bacterium]|nr:MAG: MFS transporter [Gammaproteobacteria bacterium]
MNQLKATLFTASFGCTLTIFDTSLVGVITPSLALDLGADFSQMTWVQSSFLLSFASLLMASGALSDRFGRRRMYLFGLHLFGFSALACSFAPTMNVLIIARVVQGAGAAFLLAPALAIIGHTFREPAESVKAWTMWGSLMGITMVIAPLISGFAGDFLGWRWAFLSLVAISGALIITVPRVIDESREHNTGPFDWSGAFIFCFTMLAWTWALISGSQHGWGNQQPLAASVLGCLSFGLLIKLEHGKELPMLDLHLFRSARFVGAVIAMLGYAGTAQVMIALLPLYLQQGMGVSFFGIGIALLPFSLSMFLSPSLARRLSGRWDSSCLLTVGLLLISAGNFWLSFTATSGSFNWSCVGMAILGIGGGLINGETQKAILGSMHQSKQGMGSGISTTARFLGLLIGFTGLSSVLALGIKDRLREVLCAEKSMECPQLQDTFQRVLAGQNNEILPQMQLSASSVYSEGFGDLFLFAACVALLSAFICVVLNALNIARSTEVLAEKCADIG